MSAEKPAKVDLRNQGYIAKALGGHLKVNNQGSSGKLSTDKKDSAAKSDKEEGELLN